VKRRGPKSILAFLCDFSLCTGQNTNNADEVGAEAAKLEKFSDAGGSPIYWLPEGSPKMYHFLGKVGRFTFFGWVRYSYLGDCLCNNYVAQLQCQFDLKLEKVCILDTDG